MQKSSSILGWAVARLQPGRADITRLSILILSLFALCAATWLALHQLPPGQFDPLPARFSYRWWITPVERLSFFRPPMTRDDFAAGAFVDPQTGWVLQDRRFDSQELSRLLFYPRLLHTDDGGKSWTTQWESNDRRNGRIHSIAYFDRNSVWIIGDSIWHSDDGGKSWGNQTGGPANLYLNSGSFVSPTEGWIVGDSGRILHTTNGGSTWSSQSSTTSENLNSVKFVSTQLGWAVGENGVIIHTENGGVRWTTQASPTKERMNSVTFVSPQLGWAVGLSGTILHTEDGGQTWILTNLSLPNNSALKSVDFVSPLVGWAAGTDGTILSTTNGGGAWFQQAGSPGDFNAVSFVSAQSGWAFGDQGRVLHTEDGGRTWVPDASGEINTLKSLAFDSPQSGWAVGYSGTILHTKDDGTTWDPQTGYFDQEWNAVVTPASHSAIAFGRYGLVLRTVDGGENWQAQADTRPIYLNSATFTSATEGWAVGDTGSGFEVGSLDHPMTWSIFHTIDGGTKWVAQLEGWKSYLSAVTFVPEQGISKDGWAVGKSATILHTSDGGKTWTPQHVNGPQADLSAVKFVTKFSGWAVGSSGVILHTDDGGATWNSEPTRASVDLLSLDFPSVQSGWAVGAGGTILHTADGGKSWSPQASGTKESLLSVRFVSELSGWTVGTNGTILHTSNGGRSWTSQGYKVYPAPWFPLAVILCVSGMVWGVWWRTFDPSGRIEELANSDAPVEKLEDDLLGRKELVERLSRFIRNPRTSPPLVIAVQAKWGVGKSSVMQMLLHELERNGGAQTVWFNAWHHQKEDQLLACLLETVQKEAIPPLFSFPGLLFRWNLVRVRLFRESDRAIFSLLALLGFSILAALFAAGNPVIMNAIQTVEGLVPPEAASWLPEDLGIALLSVFVWMLAHPLRAFHSDPEKLTEKQDELLRRTVKDFVSLPSLIGKTDVREEFRKNLCDVTEAFGNRRLVIFLDDLDRCRPEQVVQILEAVNFLSSAAKCFILIGADYQKVEALVARQFEEIAVQEEEIRLVREKIDPPEDKRPWISVRVAYASQYLKKIVNLRLNLRPAEKADREKFLGKAPKAPASNGAVWKSLIMAVALCAVIAAHWGAQWLQQKADDRSTRSQATSAERAAVAVNPASTGPFAGPSTRSGDGTSRPTFGATGSPKAPASAAPSAGPVAAGKPAAAEDSINKLFQKQTEDQARFGFTVGTQITLWIGLGVVILIFLTLWFGRPRNKDAQDSEKFRDALESRSVDIWERYDTPREIRRFLNYVRLVSSGVDDIPSDGTESIRKQINRENLEEALVDLAVNHLEREDNLDEAEKYFVEQCRLFGLDPATFEPGESNEKRRAESREAIDSSEAPSKESAAEEFAKV